MIFLVNETKLQNDTLNIYDLEEEINNTIKVSGIPSVWEYIYIDPQIEKATILWDNYVNFTFNVERITRVMAKRLQTLELKI